MLEADIGDDNSDRYDSVKKRTHQADSITGSSKEQKKPVTYEIFLREYWPHFPQSLTKRLGKRAFACLRGYDLHL